MDVRVKLIHLLAAAPGAGLVAVGGDNLDELVGGGHAVLGQLLGDLLEHGLHVVGRLGRRLEEDAAVVLRVGACLGGPDLALLLQVILVAGERDDDVGRTLTLELLDDRLGAVERVLVGDVVHD